MITNSIHFKVFVVLATVCAVYFGQSIKKDGKVTSGEDEGGAKQRKVEEDRKNARMITMEELAEKVDPDNTGDKEIWLSVLGEVYDVTAGRDYYAGTTGYAVFAGQDASVPFVTGAFTNDEAKKRTEDIPVTQLGSLVEWRKFYEDADNYHFKGFLIDPRWYDENGEQTEHLKLFHQRVESFQAMKAATKAK